MTKPLGALDFETDAIEARPHYPPKPVGVALRSASFGRKYLAWGHPTENNCTRSEAEKALKRFVRDHTLLCHHAGFDLDVLETHFKISWPAEHEDTLLLAFFEDPDSESLSLKPLAERYLDEPPIEQDAIRDFVLDMKKAGHKDFAGATKKNFGKYIAKCPGNLVAKYAIGDVDRTWNLRKRFQKTVLNDERFRKAYDRERRVTKALIRMERRGIPMATDRLRKDIKAYEDVLRGVEQPLLKALKVPKADWHDILHDYESQDAFKWSGKGFAERLLSSGLVKRLPQTENGNDSTSGEALATVMSPSLAKEFEVRAQIANCLGTFMRNWLAQAEETNGLFFARFNQVRAGDEWGKKTGARTGRLSMTPNLQNASRSDKDPRVPVLRDYLVKGPYKKLVERDYSQQELRILAHYEEGPFLQSYIKNPRQDGHVLVRDLIRAATGLQLERRPVKDLNFGLIYGQGLALTAEKLGVPQEEARRLRDAHMASLPGVPVLQSKIKQRVALNEPIWTWGGRRYFCEPPAFIRGRWYNFTYKMLNKLIQGSAADCTKQAMVNYDELGGFADENPMLLQVHDSLLLGANGDDKKVHEALRDAMADVEFKVPMLSDGKTGSSSWHKMKKVPY